MSLGLLFATAGINFASGFFRGVGESNAAYYKADDYNQQADILRKNAYLTRLNGARNEDVLRTQNRAYLSRATAAANETGMGESPTMMSAFATSLSMLEQNVLNERYKVESEAENYLYQANVASYNARQMRKKSRNAFRSSLISGISSALTSLPSSSLV